VEEEQDRPILKVRQGDAFAGRRRKLEFRRKITNAQAVFPGCAAAEHDAA